MIKLLNHNFKQAVPFQIKKVLLFLLFLYPFGLWGEPFLKSGNADFKPELPPFLLEMEDEVVENSVRSLPSIPLPEIESPQPILPVFDLSQWCEKKETEKDKKDSDSPKDKGD